jgi:ethanolamine utilization protein EutP (predicted NTPase)
MKKTKTGLHIETRKNRIEVYTKADLQEKKRKEQETRNLIITGTLLLFGILIFTFGLIIGSKI